MLSRKLKYIGKWTKIYCCFSTGFNISKDYFKQLGVSRTATQAQIKAAYYKLAMKYHPDHNKGNESKIKQVNEAYSVLSDQKLKKEYQMAKFSGPGFQQPNEPYQRGSQNPYQQTYQQTYTYNPFNNTYTRYEQPGSSYRPGEGFHYDPYAQQHFRQNQYNQAQWNPEFTGDPYRRESYEQRRARRMHEQYQRQQEEEAQFIATNFRYWAIFSISLGFFLLIWVLNPSNFGFGPEPYNPNKDPFYDQSRLASIQRARYASPNSDQSYPSPYQPQAYPIRHQ